MGEDRFTVQVTVKDETTGETTTVDFKARSMALETRYGDPYDAYPYGFGYQHPPMELLRFDFEPVENEGKWYTATTNKGG